MASFFPRIGSWYEDQDTGQKFEIVALDEKQKTIEVQYYDGDISEYEMESWASLNVRESEAPDEAYGGFDAGLSYGDEAPLDSTFMQGNPIELIEPDSFSGFDDLF